MIHPYNHAPCHRQQILTTEIMIAHQETVQKNTTGQSVKLSIGHWIIDTLNEYY